MINYSESSKKNQSVNFFYELRFLSPKLPSSETYRYGSTT